MFQIISKFVIILNSAAEIYLNQEKSMVDIKKTAYLKSMGIPLWRSNKCRLDGAIAISDDYLDSTASPQKEFAPQNDAARAEWDQFKSELEHCVSCEICKTRKQIVLGDGNLNADIMIIGEAPGANEDEQGKPFVGRAGQLLTNMLLSIGIDRKNVYIANILKCRPPNNRDPSPEEIKNCMPFLQKQIAVIQPKVMITLGRIASQALLNTDKTMGNLRGKVFEYGEAKIPLIPTYHPAYLLRSPTQKAKVYEDLLIIKKD